MWTFCRVKRTLKLSVLFTTLLLLAVLLPSQPSRAQDASESRVATPIIQTTRVMDTWSELHQRRGYFRPHPIVLDRQAGYTLRFTAQVSQERHASSDRAGFSIILLSRDVWGIELAFWETEIWAQEGGNLSTLFTHAEGVRFDTTRKLTAYELAVRGDTYTLLADERLLLQGNLRDYSAFTGFPNPYRAPNFLFLGDNTRRSAATVALTDATLWTTNRVPLLIATAGSPLPISGMTVISAESPDNITVIMVVDHGQLHVRTDIRGGITTSSIMRNGSDIVVLTDSLQAINQTLAAPMGLVYTSNMDFAGIDMVMAFTAPDVMLSARIMHIQVAK